MGPRWSSEWRSSMLTSFCAPTNAVTKKDFKYFQREYFFSKETYKVSILPGQFLVWMHRSLDSESLTQLQSRCQQHHLPPLSLQHRASGLFSEAPPEPPHPHDLGHTSSCSCAVSSLPGPSPQLTVPRSVTLRQL